MDRTTTLGKGAMVDVFISYARADHQWAAGLAKCLQQAGLTVFLDTASLTPGEKWTNQLQQELKNSATVLLLASPTAVVSPTVNQELGIAIGKGTPIIPIVHGLTPNQLPPWISQYQAVVLTDKPLEQAVAEITKLVQTLVKQKQERNTSELIKLAAGLVLFVAMLKSE